MGYKTKRIKSLCVTCIPAILLLVSTVSQSYAKGINLYLQPEETLKPVATIPLDDPRLNEASPMIERPKKEEGWHWLRYEHDYKGYVAKSSFSGTSGNLEEAIVYLSDDVTSPILTVLEADDDIIILKKGKWTQIKFTKAVPVYFKFPQESDDEVRDAHSMATSHTEESPVAQPDKPESGKSLNQQAEPQTGRASETTNAVPSPSATAHSTLVPADTLSDMDDDDASTGSQSTDNPFAENHYRKPPARELPRYLDGRLQKPKGLFAFANGYDLELANQKGRRIAYVITNELQFPSPLTAYLDKDVIIRGIVEKHNDHIVITASNLRLK